MDSDLSQTPVIPPPPGVESNFTTPPSLMAAVITGTVLIQVIVLPFILARIGVNSLTRTFRIEDLFCYLAYAAMIAQATLVVHASAIGGARNLWNISVLTLGTVMRYYNYILLCWTLSGYFGRTFILLQFKRLFTTDGIKGSVYWVIIASIAANTALYFAFLMSYVFECYPREKIWNPEIGGRCVKTTKLQLATGILNILSDVEVLLVPLFAIWRLKMKLEHKVRVFAVFSVGALAIAIACLGLWLRIKTANALDFTWPLTQLAIVCQAELGGIIIVGCTPYLPRLFRWRQFRAGSAYYPPSGSRSTGYSDKASKKQSSGLSETRSRPDAEGLVSRGEGGGEGAPQGSAPSQRYYGRGGEGHEALRG